MSTETSQRDTGRDLERLAREVIAMLALSFLLGLGVTLIGLPSETDGAARTVTVVALILHILVAVGLAVAAVRGVMAARGGTRFRSFVAGAVLIALTIVAGVLTMATENDAWSYAMGVGFLSSLLLYGRLLLPGPPTA